MHHSLGRDLHPSEARDIAEITRDHTLSAGTSARRRRTRADSLARSLTRRHEGACGSLSIGCADGRAPLALALWRPRRARIDPQQGSSATPAHLHPCHPAHLHPSSPAPPPPVEPGPASPPRPARPPPRSPPPPSPPPPPPPPHPPRRPCPQLETYKARCEAASATAAELNSSVENVRANLRAQDDSEPGGGGGGGGFDDRMDFEEDKQRKSGRTKGKLAMGFGPRK